MLNNIVALLDSGVAASTNSYESIASASGTGSSNLISFSNIPQGYKHLQLRVSARTTYANKYDTFYIYGFDGTLNSTNSSAHGMHGNGSGVGVFGLTGQFSSLFGYIPGATETANVYGSLIIDFLDYSNTNKNKTSRSLFGYDTSNTDWSLGLWSSSPVALGTSAITQLLVICNGNFTTDTKIALYGVKG